MYITRRLQIIRTIDNYSENEPLFSGNDLTYLYEFHKSLKGSKSFYKSVLTENVIKLNCRTWNYWPISIINLKKINDKESQVTIKFKLFELYLTIFVFFFLGVVALIFLAIYDKSNDPRGTLLAAFIFLTATLLLMYFFGWLQRNLIKLIEK
jgi:hypothetical protein